MLTLNLGDKIQYKFDDEIVEGIIYDIGLKEDDEANFYRWFSQEGYLNTFNLDDPDDQERVKFLDYNIFTEMPNKVKVVEGITDAGYVSPTAT